MVTCQWGYNKIKVIYSVNLAVFKPQLTIMLATCNHYINFSMRKLLFCTVSCLSAGLSAGCCERNCKTSSDCHCDRVCRKYGDCCPDVPQPEGCIEGKLTVTKTVWHATTDTTKI